MVKKEVFSCKKSKAVPHLATGVFLKLFVDYFFGRFMTVYNCEQKIIDVCIP